MALLTKSSGEASVSVALADNITDGQGIRIGVALKEDGSSVCFIAGDSGKGISGSGRDPMSHLLCQGRRPPGGLGLGLPPARRHVLSLGGLTVDAGCHGGCRFAMELPCTAGAYPSR